MDVHPGPGQQGAGEALHPGTQGQDQKQRKGTGPGIGVEARSEPRPRMPTKCVSDDFQLPPSLSP